jgi:hypothetical protein
MRTSWARRIGSLLAEWLPSLAYLSPAGVMALHQSDSPPSLDSQLEDLFLAVAAEESRWRRHKQAGHRVHRDIDR